MENFGGGYTMETPTPFKIKNVIDNGGTSEDIDELFYPGERRRCQERKAEYPIPEGTGRKRWDVERKAECGRTTNYYVGDVWIGSIYDAWKGNPNGYYKTHDGKKFAHWGGEDGAETYLIERYWLYGNPPEKTTISGALKGLVSAGKKEGGYIDDIESRWSGLEPPDKWLVTVVIMILIVLIDIIILFAME